MRLIIRAPDRIEVLEGNFSIEFRPRGQDINDSGDYSSKLIIYTSRSGMEILAFGLSDDEGRGILDAIADAARVGTLAIQLTVTSRNPTAKAFVPGDEVAVQVGAAQDKPTT